MTLLVASLVGSLLLVPKAIAQPLHAREERLLDLTLQYGNAAREAAVMAQEKAVHAEVRAYAEETRRTHELLQAQILQLRPDAGLPPQREQPSKLLRARIDLLGAYDGRRFDSRYLQQMGVELHETAADVCRQGVEQARDARVRSFAHSCRGAMASRAAAAKALRRQIEPRPIQQAPTTLR